MQKIFECIDEYLKKLEDEILDIVSDQSIALTKKNQLMEPIVDQKKILTYTKEALIKIKNKKYEAKCGMSSMS
jgi:predicted house-cleaning noncanonical NTP pyrophosphatase (MazG superfamily)